MSITVKNATYVGNKASASVVVEGDGRRATLDKIMLAVEQAQDSAFLTETNPSACGLRLCSSAALHNRSEGGPHTSGWALRQIFDDELTKTCRIDDLLDTRLNGKIIAAENFGRLYERQDRRLMVDTVLRNC